MAQIPKLLQEPANTPPPMEGVVKALTGKEVLDKVAKDLGNIRGTLIDIKKVLEDSNNIQKRSSNTLKQLIKSLRATRRAQFKEPSVATGKAQTGEVGAAQVSGEVTAAPKTKEEMQAAQPSLLSSLADVALDLSNRGRPSPTTTVPETRTQPTGQPQQPRPTQQPTTQPQQPTTQPQQPRPTQQPTTQPQQPTTQPQQPTTQPQQPTTQPQQPTTQPQQPRPAGPSALQRAGQAIMRAGQAVAPVVVPAAAAAAGGAVVGSVLAAADVRSQEQNRLTIEQRASQIPGQEEANRAAAIEALAKGGITPDKMNPEDFENAVQSQMARESRMAARRARPTQPSGVREAANRQAEAIPGVETPAQTIPPQQTQVNVAAVQLSRPSTPAPQQPQVNVAQQVQRQEPSTMRGEQVEVYDAEKFRQTDPESFNRMQARRREIEKELEDKFRGDYSPQTRERIKLRAEEQAQREFAPQIVAAGAGARRTELSVTQGGQTVSGTEVQLPPAIQPSPKPATNVGDMTTLNRDLQREQTQVQQSTPVVVNNNNNTATERVVSAPAQPRVESTFSKVQESRFMPAW